MRRLFTMMKTNFSDKGYPVIIGEYEVIHWKNGSLKDGTMDFLGTVVSLSKELGFCSMLWDFTLKNANLTTNKILFLLMRFKCAVVLKKP